MAERPSWHWLNPDYWFIKAQTELLLENWLLSRLNWAIGGLLSILYLGLAIAIGIFIAILIKLL